MGFNPLTMNSHITPETLGTGRKWIMLLLFSLAEFMDTYLASALFPAIIRLQSQLNIPSSEVTWVFSAYGATFASFLLIAGRFSDIYSKRWSFIIGALGVGLFSLGCGLTNDPITLYVLRAFTGIFGALTVPSALSLIVEWMVDPKERDRGISMFGASASLGNVLGVIIGGIFTQLVTFKWDFYLATIFGVGIAAVAVVTIPPSQPKQDKPSLKRLDLPGVLIITGAMVLFVYAVTQGAAAGWGTAKVIAPLVVSIVMTVGFFIIEAKLPEETAALPPKIWFYPNVAILFAVSLVPIFWWCSLFFQLMPRFEAIYGWSPILTSVHILPTGVVGGVLALFVGQIPSKGINPKWTILGGLVLAIIASILLPFADTHDKYWPYLFPSFVIGTVGLQVVFIHANIAIFMNTPPEVAGVVGALFNFGIQMGVALGLAILTSITVSIDQQRQDKHLDPPYTGINPSYHGIADAYWFVLAFVVLETICVAIFFKTDKQLAARKANQSDIEKDGAAVSVALDGKDDTASSRGITRTNSAIGGVDADADGEKDGISSAENIAKHGAQPEVI